MNKYKVNLIYKDNGLNLTEIIIKNLINELKIISNKNLFNLSLLSTYALKKRGKN